MGSGGAKKTNALLEEQQRAAQGLSGLTKGWAEESHGAGRGDIDWARNQYRSLYEGLGEGGGGGGGGGFTPATFGDATAEFWKNLMEKGAYDERERGAMESAATAPIRGMADMVRQGLETTARGAGTGGGYTSGLGKLLQDQAYQASEASKGAFANIAQLQAAAKERGATGLEDIETKRRAFEAAERARQASHAGGVAAGQARTLAEKEGLISRMLALEGDKDLAYIDRSLAGVGAGTQAAGARRDETPMWQKMAGSLLQGGASAALGAFLPPAGIAKAAKVAKKVIPGAGQEEVPTAQENESWMMNSPA